LAVATLAVGVPQEDVVGKQDGAGCNRDVGMPDEIVVGKQDGAGSIREYGGSEEDVVGKEDGAVIGSRMWPQECQPCGLVEENGGTPPVSQVEFRAATVVTLAGGVHEKDVVVKQDDAGSNRIVGVPEEDVE